eukprot:gnl/TRDRNA2_/TRDRNA2_152357_c0_seq2.p1 gnl/TRDRNA2_/TRDRNA2_152357_c0~~gnl/TRDRNA2_/TRDRNA2_152357_c0_seq2.p1  ORF type:complete len:282 (+),score=49.39 gnl/TRDRNA2_/TRDRNA2_152357_c0_seq2:611-1456(+)
MLSEWERQAVRAEWLQLMMKASDTLRLPEMITERFPYGALRPTRATPGFWAYIDKKYQKVVSVVDFIAASGAVGAEAVVAACEIFATGNARQWLKVAGDEKAEIVEHCLHRRPAPDRSVVVEFGSFVGYSCTRMSWRCGGSSRILTLESDAVHVLVARHVVSEALRSWGVEVLPGMAHDSVRRLSDDFGSDAASFAFMDHRGTRFHVELLHLECLRALTPGVKFLADNTLKPGAPVNLWHFRYSSDGRHKASVNWSVPEFAAESCEDWMSASDCGGGRAFI